MLEDVKMENRAGHGMKVARCQGLSSTNNLFSAVEKDCEIARERTVHLICNYGFRLELNLTVLSTVG